MEETCYVCDRFIRDKGVIFASDLEGESNIALCARHWNWWVTRWLGSSDEPPCGAHLIPESQSSGRGES